MYGRLGALHHRWMSLWWESDKDLALDAFGRLVARYSEPGRAYHNIEHIEKVLDEFEEVSRHATNALAIRLALWYHDVIYDPRAKDNELQSAEFAKKELSKFGIGIYLQSEIAQLIMATRHNVPLETPDEILITDIDLSILGKSARAYNEYAKAIRTEYGWVTIDAYRDGRTKVLQGFIDRGVYTSPYFRDKYGAQATANLTREIRELAQL